jgi:lipopolysaccharide/colanic/teichoic acid biosynthesis glycosyltransferase
MTISLSETPSDTTHDAAFAPARLDTDERAPEGILEIMLSSPLTQDGPGCEAENGRPRPSDGSVATLGLWSTLKRHLGLHGRKPLMGVHSADEFRAIMVRERSAADRHGHSFSVVAFSAVGADIPADRAERLADLLIDRIRLTDEAGWFDAHRIGALLSYTSADGARRLAKDVCRRLGIEPSSTCYEVYIYPSEEHPTRGPGTNGQSQSPLASPPPRDVADNDTDLDQPALPATLWGGAEPAPGVDSLTLSSRLESAVQLPRPAQPLEPLFAQPLPLWKRTIDITGSSVAIILLSPVMLAAASAVKLTTPGPIFFKQLRSGWRARPFMCFKFRSMVADADQRKHELMEHNHRTGPVFKMVDDPRITRVGKFIRKWSIDELPQLFNVLKGDMSLVGPRPPTLDEVEEYRLWHDRRLEVTPGITCLWQITARHDKCFERWVRLDLEYARRRSFWFDLQILLRTLPAVISRRGAC